MGYQRVIVFFFFFFFFFLEKKQRGINLNTIYILYYCILGSNCLYVSFKLFYNLCETISLFVFFFAFFVF